MTDITKPLSGFALSFRIDNAFTDGQYVDVISNVSMNGFLENSFVRLINASELHWVHLYVGTTSVEKFLVGAVMPHLVAVVYYQNYICISLDGVGVHVFYPYDVVYNTDDVAVSIKSGHAASLSLIRLKELCDWREAIFADLETTSQSAISSVIQQRPVEIFGVHTGAVRYQYFPSVRPSKEISLVSSHDVTTSGGNQISSEGIVYFTDTGIQLDLDAFEDFGFITRTFRLPDLDSGAMKAAAVMQLRARQSAEQHQIACRFDPTIEVGDQVTSSVVLPGTGTVVTDIAIIESAQISLAEGKYAMRMKGRGIG